MNLFDIFLELLKVSLGENIKYLEYIILRESNLICIRISLLLNGATLFLKNKSFCEMLKF